MYWRERPNLIRFSFFLSLSFACLFASLPHSLYYDWTLEVNVSHIYTNALIFTNLHDKWTRILSCSLSLFRWTSFTPNWIICRHLSSFSIWVDKFSIQKQWHPIQCYSFLHSSSHFSWLWNACYLLKTRNAQYKSNG